MPDPVYDQLQTVGGNPGGGLVGALYANQNLGQELLNKQAVQQRDIAQAQELQSQATRTLGMLPYEQAASGAGTEGKMIENQVNNALAPYKTMVGQAQSMTGVTQARTAQSKAVVDSMMANSQALEGLPPGMQAAHMAQYAVQNGVDPNTDPAVSAIIKSVQNGTPLGRIRAGHLDYNEQVRSAETRGAAEVASAGIHGEAQKAAAATTANSRVAVAQLNNDTKQLLVQHPEQQISMAQQRMRTATTPEEQEYWNNYLQNAQRMLNMENNVKAYVAAHGGTALDINKILNPGNPGETAPTPNPPATQVNITPPGVAPQPQAPVPRGPVAGRTVIDGYMYIGGDPSQQASWKKQ